MKLNKGDVIKIKIEGRHRPIVRKVIEADNFFEAALIYFKGRKWIRYSQILK